MQKKIAVIHNGIVENYQEFKKDLISKKHHFSSETDTEVIAHLIEEKLKTKTISDAVFTTFNELVGSNAVGVIDLRSETIVACRNGSPLAVGLDKNQFFLASDVPAFLKYTNKVYFLEDGEGIVLTKDNAELYDLKSRKKKPFLLKTIDFKIEDAEKGGYPHFLLKEINEQKKLFRKRP